MDLSSKEKELVKLLLPDEEATNPKKIRAKLAEALRRYAETIEAMPQRHQSINFSEYHTRMVAMELLYLGFDCDGFACQPDNERTIEAHLFRALRSTCLVPEAASYEELRYTRCGRTDKGVSAYRQIIALKVRSKARTSDPLPSEDEETDFPALLNRNLPKTIRVTAWRTVADDFNARYGATYREYKYFFFVQRGKVDVDRMVRAAAMLEGEHDFRNFCKINADNALNLVRKIFFARIVPASNFDFQPPVQGQEGAAAGEEDGALPHVAEAAREEGVPSTSGASAAQAAVRSVTAPGAAIPGTVVPQGEMYMLVIRGTGFLWHMIRCIMAVLLLVGEGKEEPEVVRDLLDMTQWEGKGKPQYNMAPPEPLTLSDCGFAGLEFPLSRTAARTLADLEEVRDGLAVRAVVAAHGYESVRRGYEEAARRAGTDPGTLTKSEEVRGPKHVALKHRPREMPVEERVAKLRKAGQLKTRSEEGAAGDSTANGAVGLAGDFEGEG